MYRPGSITCSACAESIRLSVTNRACLLLSTLSQCAGSSDCRRLCILTSCCSPAMCMARFHVFYQALAGKQPRYVMQPEAFKQADQGLGIADSWLQRQISAIQASVMIMARLGDLQNPSDHDGFLSFGLLSYMEPSCQWQSCPVTSCPHQLETLLDQLSCFSANTAY